MFLPVKSPSPNTTKDKTRKPSPSSSDGGTDNREREVKLKQRELLPLFDESTDMHYPNLLDGDALIEDLLVTKRVDPTSYSGKISHDSEDSKSGDTSETTVCNGDDQDNYDSSSLQESIYTMDDLKRPSYALCEEQEECSLEHTAKLGKNDRESEKTIDEEPLCSSHLTEETKTKVEDTILQKCSKMTEADAVCSDNVVSRFEENMPLTKDNVRSEVDAEPRSSSSVEENTGACSGVPIDGMRTEDAENPDKDPAKIKEDISSDPRQTEKEEVQLVNQAPNNDPLLNTQAAIGSDGSNGKLENPGHHRADALESLLELCARLLKQDKFDELSGVLKAFGEDAVSSRETAILLTKSLMNAQKLAKDS